MNFKALLYMDSRQDEQETSNKNKPNEYLPHINFEIFILM